MSTGATIKPNRPDAMPDTKRARNVCQACMLRKKACDKALPACGFCAGRGLHCRYDTAPQKSNGQRRYNPGKHFVALQSPVSPGVSAYGTGITRALPFSESKGNDAHIRGSSLYIPLAALGNPPNPLVQRLIDFTHFNYDEIIERYFINFHTSFPVVSPDSLCQEASRYQQEWRLPPASFTVLLLAMTLIVSPPLTRPFLPPGITQELLYTTTKAAFSQAQASITTSLRLVQAAVLIALREYTGTRPDAAYVSLMGCVGMAQISGIETTMIRRKGDLKKTGDLQLNTLEKENVAWAIAMLERLILCEIGQPNLAAQTEYPGPEYLLPSELTPAAGLDYSSDPNLEKLHKSTLTSLHPTVAGSFGWQTQVISLLDRLLTVMRYAGSDMEPKLAGLDGKIQHFLKAMLNEPDWSRTAHSVPAAMCVRQLLLLHGSVLDTRQRHPQSEADCQREDIASIGFKSACRILLDVMEFDGDGLGLAMPICCFYSIQEARRRIQERKGFLDDERLARDVDTLLSAERRYHKTWTIQRLTPG